MRRGRDGDFLTPPSLTSRVPCPRYRPHRDAGKHIRIVAWRRPLGAQPLEERERGPEAGAGGAGGGLRSFCQVPSLLPPQPHPTIPILRSALRAN